MKTEGMPRRISGRVVESADVSLGIALTNATRGTYNVVRPKTTVRECLLCDIPSDALGLGAVSCSVLQVFLQSRGDQVFLARRQPRDSIGVVW